MDLKYYHPLLLSLLVLSTTTFLLSSSASAVDVHKLCKKTDYPSLCNAIVKPGRGGPAQAIKSAILGTILHTRQAQSKAKRVVRSADAVGKEKLSVCQELYDDALWNLGSSLKSLKKKSQPELRMSLSAVMSDLETCDDTFRERPARASPLAKDNELLKHLASNSLALATDNRI